MLRTPEDAFALMQELGASSWLVQHHRLVVEAAAELCERVTGPYDRELVKLGAAVHDMGKVRHPEEMSGPGHQHEEAGRKLLTSRGVSDHVARFCVTHASWTAPNRTTEDLLVALADKLWKGKRVSELEELAVTRLANARGEDRWSVFSELDAVFEDVASRGDLRLARSSVS